MALPIIESPKYTLEIPSTGKTVEYRPFLVKEEKILLMAQESEDSREMLSAMKEIVKACTLEKINPNDLTSFDLEFIFLKLRAKSVGETSTVNIKCSECETFTGVSVNIDEISVNIDPAIEKTVMLTDTIGVNLRYIRVKDMGSLSDNKKTQSDLINEVLIASIESIFDSNAVYPSDQSTKAEITTFINSLNRSQMQKIEQFISSAPQLEKEIHFTCKGCAHENDTKLSGTQSFFA